MGIDKQRVESGERRMWMRKCVLKRSLICFDGRHVFRALSLCVPTGKPNSAKRDENATGCSLKRTKIRQACWWGRECRWGWGWGWGWEWWVSPTSRATAAGRLLINFNARQLQLLCAWQVTPSLSLSLSLCLTCQLSFNANLRATVANSFWFFVAHNLICHVQVRSTMQQLSF